MKGKANGASRPRLNAAALIQFAKLAEEDRPASGATYLIHMDDKAISYSRLEHGGLVPKGRVNLTP